MDIRISRKGEQFGPYPEAVARQYLEDGTLAATDLAWHSGADDWKPLGEVLGIATQVSPEPQPPPEPTPPPTPAASLPATPATSGPPPATPAGDPATAAGDADEIFITRKGQQIGPAPRAKAMELFTAGKLVPTDWGWHDGMDEWKPLYEVLGMEVPAQTAFAPAAAAPAQSVRAAPVRSGGIVKKVVPVVGVVVLIVLALTVPALGYAIAKAFFIGGLVMAVISGFWFIVEAFKKSVVWGLLCIFIPFASLIFLVMHWNVARWPFLFNLASWAVVFIGVIIGAWLSS